MVAKLARNSHQKMLKMDLQNYWYALLCCCCLIVASLNRLWERPTYVHTMFQDILFASFLDLQANCSRLVSLLIITLFLLWFILVHSWWSHSQNFGLLLESQWTMGTLQCVRGQYYASVANGEWQEVAITGISFPWLLSL